MRSTLPSWIRITACAALVMTLSMGVRQVSGLFLGPVSADLGLSRDAFGMAVALQNLVWGLTQPIAGLLADRHGARPVVIAGALLYVVGMAVAALAQDGFTFTVGLGVLCGLGQSGTAFAVILAVIGRVSPNESRSTALGVGSAAGSVGMFVLVPLTGALIELTAWRSTMLMLAALLAAMIALGWALGGEREAAIESSGTASGSAAIQAAGRDRDYWLVNLGFAVCGFQLAFIATFLPTILVDRGLPLATGAAVLAAIGAFNIIGTYLAGLAGGRWLKKDVLAALYLARAIAIAGFLLLPLSTTSAIVFGAVIGLLWTGTVPLTSGLVADLWGRRNLGFLFAVVYIGHQVGAFAGAWSAGLAYERTGSFDLAWIAAIAGGVIAAVFHLVLQERPRALALEETRSTPA
jgi:predicted MFS family arabinose efflux permease